MVHRFVRRRRLFAVCGALLVSVAVMVAGSGASSAAAKPSIALFVAIQANPYEASLIAAAQKEAKALGASLQVFDPADVPAKQVTECQDALTTKKYNIFLIKAVAGSTMEPCAKAAIKAGIKVVAVDDPLGPAYTLAPQVPGIVGSILSLPQTAYGAEVKLDVAACKKLNPCNLAFYYGPAAFSFSAYGSKYFLAQIKKYKNIHVIASATWNFDIPTSASLARTLLVAHPDVNVIQCDGDQGAVAIEGVLEKAGKAGKVTVVGGGGSIQAKTAILAGKQFGTSALYPASLGKLSVLMGVNALQGKPVGNKAYDVSIATKLGPLVDKSNVAQFKPQWGT